MGFGITELLIILLILPLAFLPTIIAIKKDHPYKLPIILINVFGGMLWGLGWLVSLVWCFITPEKKNSSPTNVSNEIEKLHELLEKGILTQEEFDTKKKILLDV